METEESATSLWVAALAAIPDRVEALVRRAGVSGEPVRGGVPIGEGEWTPAEIVGHLCDAARYWGGRMRRVVYEENPPLPMFDEDTSVRLAAYRYRPLDGLLREFRLLSEGNVAFLRGLGTEAWERAGEHPVRGQLTLREMVEIEGGHERGHVEQLAHTLGVSEE